MTPPLVGEPRFPYDPSSGGGLIKRSSSKGAVIGEPGFPYRNIIAL